jgi:hypothetical protein
MSRIDYTYVAIRYTHNPTSGEALNVGVLLCAPERGFVRCRTDHHVRRLTQAFAHFDVTLHRRALKKLRMSVEQVQARFHERGENLFETLGDAESVLRSLWPDMGTQYTCGPLMYGTTSDPKGALEMQFERLVLENVPRSDERPSREDDDVWEAVAPALRQRQLLNPFVDRTVETPDGPLHFDHTHQNGRLHVVQPLSFDLIERESMLRKAHTWFGRGDSMARSDRFGEVVFVLGRPAREELLDEYDRCRRILERIELRPAIFEETEIEALGDRVDQLLQAH